MNLAQLPLKIYQLNNLVFAGKVNLVKLWTEQGQISLQANQANFLTIFDQTITIYQEKKIINFTTKKGLLIYQDKKLTLISSFLQQV